MTMKEHNNALGHPIPLSSTNILAKKCKCKEQPTVNVTDIMLHPKNMSRAWTLPMQIMVASYPFRGNRHSPRMPVAILR